MNEDNQTAKGLDMKFIQLEREQIKKINKLIEADKDIFDYIYSLFPEYNRYKDALKYDTEKGFVCVFKSIKS